MRKEEEILAEWNELDEKTWWRRHKILSAGKADYPQEDFEKQKAIEEKYGLENLPQNNYENLLLEGRMSGLSWALGNDWESSGDD